MKRERTRGRAGRRRCGQTPSSGAVTRRLPARPGGRGQTVRVALEGLGHLSRARLRVVELADLLGISTRAVYRLLGFFREYGLPVRSEKKGRLVRYWVQKT